MESSQGLHGSAKHTTILPIQGGKTEPLRHRDDFMDEKTYKSSFAVIGSDAAERDINCENEFGI